MDRRIEPVEDGFVLTIVDAFGETKQAVVGEEELEVLMEEIAWALDREFYNGN